MLNEITFTYVEKLKGYFVANVTRQTRARVYVLGTSCTSKRSTAFSTRSLLHLHLVHKATRAQGQ